MKTKLIILFLIVGSSIYAQSASYSKFDDRLVGSWNGSETDQQVIGMEKHWVQHRFEDGTFILLFTTLQDGVMESFAEKGEWWIEDGKFYELHFISGVTDVYNFKILDEDHIKFISIKNLKMAVETYEFIDTRITEEVN